MSVWIFRKPHQRIDTHKTILTCCYSENHINVPIFRKPQWRIDILKTKLTYRYSETHSNISICRNPHSRITIQKATLTNRYSETHNNGLHHSKRFLPSSSSKIRCSQILLQQNPVEKIEEEEEQIQIFKQKLPTEQSVQLS